MNENMIMPTKVVLPRAPAWQRRTGLGRDPHTHRHTHITFNIAGQRHAADTHILTLGRATGKPELRRSDHSPWRHATLARLPAAWKVSELEPKRLSLAAARPSIACAVSCLRAVAARVVLSKRSGSRG